MFKLFGFSNTIYDLIGILGISPFIITPFLKYNKKMRTEYQSNFTKYMNSYFYSYCKKTKLNLFFSSQQRWITIETFIILFVQLSCFLFAGEILGELIDKRTDVYGYLFSAPIFLTITSYIISANPLQILDSITPVSCFVISILKLSCFFAGCCNTVETTFGMYNQCTERIEFPIQLVELLIYLILFFIIAILRKKKTLKVGTLFPVFVVSYSSIRFVLQFFKDEEIIINIFHISHLINFSAIIIFSALILIINRYGDTIVKRFNRPIEISYIEKKKIEYINQKNHVHKKRKK